MAIRALDLPKPLSMLCDPGLYQPTREQKLRACRTAYEALPYILPREFWSSTFHLWHDDLHALNIFVKENDPSELVAIIDWESTTISLMFDHKIVPPFLIPDRPRPSGLEMPPMPEHFKDESEETPRSLEMWTSQTLYVGHKAMMESNVKSIWKALVYRDSDNMESAALGTSYNLFELGEAICLGAIADLRLVRFDFLSSRGQRLRPRRRGW
jgi:hypothetical protein